MAHFDTSLVFAAIANDTLADHESNRQMVELVDQIQRLGAIHGVTGHRIDKQALVCQTLEIVFRQMAKSQHGHDLVVGLIDRLMEEARAESLARIELMAAGMVPYEVEETLREFPEVAGKYMRHPTRQELDEGGAI
jgi:hypothetical protein